MVRFLGAAPADADAPAIPAKLEADIAALEPCPPQGLATAAKSLLNWLAGEADPQANKNPADFFASLRPGDTVTATQWRESCGALLFVFQGCVRENMGPAAVLSDLEQLGLGRAGAEAIASVWKEKFAALSRSAAESTLMVNELVDLRWKSGVTVSSSDCAKVGTAFLQMDLTLDRGNAGATDNVQLELSLPQFYEMLSEMQKAKSNLEFFSG